MHAVVRCYQAAVGRRRTRAVKTDVEGERNNKMYKNEFQRLNA